MSPFWQLLVGLLVGGNVLGLAWLLWWTAKRRPGDPKPEQTSHYWDEDITEFNKPMPRWWIRGFYLSLVFAVGYLFWFGGLGTYPGWSNWSSQAEHAADKAAWDAELAKSFSQFEQQPLDQLAKNPQALALGRSVFANSCSTCHGSSARGATGYPNLSDRYWQWGGNAEDILNSVLHGRQAAMPALGAAVGGETGIRELAVYVQSLAGRTVDPTLAAAGGKRFAGICAACHGADGSGNQSLGAPNLRDEDWLYGGSFEAIAESIRNGRAGVMPAHAPLLGKTRARLAAAYVFSLSHTSDAKADPE